MMTAANMRIGHGYDLHRLELMPPEGNGKPLVLGGVRIEHPMGPVGHSDGDAVLHAIVDALLGAVCEPDIGQLFPDDDPRHLDQDSAMFVAEAAQRIDDAGYEIGNIDITIVCERPRIGPHKQAMRARVATLLDCDLSQVNVKGKTHEQVDAIGEGRAVEAHVVVLLVRLP